jgi:uncharacterized protein (DUF3820 family)
MNLHKASSPTHIEATRRINTPPHSRIEKRKARTYHSLANEIGFGKWKDRALADVPFSYLDWAIRENVVAFTQEQRQVLGDIRRGLVNALHGPTAFRKETAPF